MVASNGKRHSRMSLSEEGTGSGARPGEDHGRVAHDGVGWGGLEEELRKIKSIRYWSS